ncbi:MAG: TIGR00725 family protein [bacterium]
MIGVIGGGRCSPEIEEMALEVGALIAQRNATLICGGLGGVMRAACMGAKSKNGETIGVLPGYRKDEANPHVDIPIVTGLADARNIIVVRSSDAVIAIDGKDGTLSEISFCFICDVPVIGLKSWAFDPRIIQANTPKEAVDKAFSLLA